jgi:hypothetical protein
LVCTFAALGCADDAVERLVAQFWIIDHSCACWRHKAQLHALPRSIIQVIELQARGADLMPRADALLLAIVSIALPSAATLVMTLAFATSWDRSLAFEEWSQNNPLPVEQISLASTDVRLHTPVRRTTLVRLRGGHHRVCRSSSATLQTTAHWRVGGPPATLTR